MIPTRKQSRRRRGEGFTLVELLVVIAVMIIMVTATLFAFGAVRRTNRIAGAMNALNAAMSTARNLAQREGRDVAVMFRFDTRRHVTSMEFLVMETTVYDAQPHRSTQKMTAASVFVPLVGQAPIELPRGAGVYGLGFGVSRHHQNPNPANPANWYADFGRLPAFNFYANNDPWILPRSDPRFYSEERWPPSQRDIELLDTFIVRFSPSGAMTTNAPELNSRFGVSAQGGDAFLELDPPGHTDFGVWRPWVDTSTEPVTIHAELQLRAAPMLAVVDLYQMGDELGIREPWLTVGPDLPGNVSRRERMDFNDNGIPDQYEINDWINQHAMQVSFNRYTGQMMRQPRR